MKIVIPKELSLPSIPPGVYRATFTGHKYRTTSTEKPALQLELTLKTQGPNPDVKTVGRKIFDLITLSEDTMWRLNMPFKAVTGVDLPAGTEFSVEELIAFVTGSLMGQDVVINTDLREYQGTMRDNIKSYQTIV